MTDQIPSSVIETNALVVAEAAAISAGIIHQNTAHANALASENSVSAQNKLNILYPAIVASAAALINNA